MVLEAIEDYRRGWVGDNVGLGGERVTRGKLAVEHVMPRKWIQHWPVTDTELAARERDRLLHTFGNLTLLTGKLNSSVSNGPWVGKNSKRDGLESHDVLMLNRDLLSLATDDWNEDKIRDRTGDLTEAIIKIWPVPDGHRSGSAQLARIKKRVDIADLLNAGLLESGETLFPRSQNPQGMIAIILSDGSLDIGGEIFATPSAAAMSITGNPTNGWWYFLSQDGVKSSSLRTLRSTYAEGLSEDIEDEIEDDDTDEDEEN